MTVSITAPALALSGRTVAVVGLGYVGLPTALSLADHGAAIVGYDVSETRLADIKSARVDLLARDRARLALHLHADSLALTTEANALAGAEAVVVCVPTPVDAHQSPDLRALRGACAAVVANAVSGQTIVLTSTTYVGCTRELLVKPLEDKGFEIGTDVFVAFAPERIDPGVESHAPDHTPRVLGGVTRRCTAQATAVLRHTASSLHAVSSPEAAEMTKLVENTFRAVNIALANEFSDMAGELNVDVVEVISAAATKPYGFMPFYPGPGVGGHCIPCDPHYLLWQLRAKRHDSPVTRTAMTAIALRPRNIVAKGRQMLAESGIATAGAHILVVGVTYKPDVADVRESPAVEIVDELIAAGAAVEYTDSWVDRLETPQGTLMSHETPEQGSWDLVLVHTRHANTDLDWLAKHLVLDATYRRS
ncbi:nucleotide sugar dehydrogenase [Mycobacterium sp. ITM-2016-00318]|uniref:nucleotide sugar dehydrogenase n=1 Tax=Mycobacterium sp. ITM-2016-00318 TaxID=2099693 RepID=UPI000CF95458|nr:nucleotide sugar dehydrogenase [Mycobacterium sp. ITM-2016-00318]WNG92964.1 nucleotide sugar dehydrogenase [Mycobacterium sp. ITM-2016-00318]